LTISVNLRKELTPSSNHRSQWCTLHGDGQLMRDLMENEKVDRLPIIISWNNFLFLSYHLRLTKQWLM